MHLIRTLVLAIAWLATRAVLDARVLASGGGALAVMTACGAIVAIEVWPTVSAAWVFLIAFTLSSLVAARRARAAGGDPAGCVDALDMAELQS